MKHLFLFILLVFSSFAAFSQTGDQLFGMINTSLIRYTELVQENRDKLSAQANGGIHPVRFADSYLAMDNYPLGFEFSAPVKELGFQYIYLQSEAARKVLKTPRAVVFMAGPSIENNTLTITFSSRTVVRKNNTLDIAVADWVRCTWQYACNTGKWEQVSVDSGGL